MDFGLSLVYDYLFDKPGLKKLNNDD